MVERNALGRLGERIGEDFTGSLHKADHRLPSHPDALVHKEVLTSSLPMDRQASHAPGCLLPRLFAWSGQGAA